MVPFFLKPSLISSRLYKFLFIYVFTTKTLFSSDLHWCWELHLGFWSLRHEGFFAYPLCCFSNPSFQPGMQSPLSNLFTSGTKFTLFWQLSTNNLLHDQMSIQIGGFWCTYCSKPKTPSHSVVHLLDSMHLLLNYVIFGKFHLLGTL